MAHGRVVRTGPLVKGLSLIHIFSREYARLTDRFEDAGGYEWPSRIQGVLAGLGFAKGREDQPASVLSGGEKTRLCLARLLLTQPDLLMLDEPTNHLDLSSIQWLEETLKKYRGTVLIISHDRYFMNSVCDCMAEISMRRLVQYEGNYDQFTVKRQADIERQIREYKLQQAEIARQQAIIPVSYTHLDVYKRQAEKPHVTASVPASHTWPAPAPRRRGAFAK